MLLALRRWADSNATRQSDSDRILLDLLPPNTIFNHHLRMQLLGVTADRHPIMQC